MLDIKAIEERGKEFEGTHKFLSEELLCPCLNKCDAMRINMFTNHLIQSKVLDKPEFPNVFTNFENKIGKYSTAYKKSNNYKLIVAKIKKNDMCYVYLLLDENNNLDIVHIKPAERITERYGYRYDTPILEKNEDEYINENELLYKSSTYDQKMNFCFGTNLRSVYLSYLNETYED